MGSSLTRRSPSSAGATAGRSSTGRSSGCRLEELRSSSLMIQARRISHLPRRERDGVSVGLVPPHLSSLTSKNCVTRYLFRASRNQNRPTRGLLGDLCSQRSDLERGRARASSLGASSSAGPASPAAMTHRRHAPVQSVVSAARRSEVNDDPAALLALEQDELVVRERESGHVRVACDRVGEPAGEAIAPLL